jgi:hypothetical protein
MFRLLSWTRAIIAKLPLASLLTDLYAREMCYDFTDALPADNVQTTGYEIGEIIYWPPRHSCFPDDFVLIKGGMFTMGSPAREQQRRLIQAHR